MWQNARDINVHLEINDTNFPLLYQMTTSCPYRKDIYYVCYPTSVSYSSYNHSNIVLKNDLFSAGYILMIWLVEIGKSLEKLVSHIHSHNGDLKKVSVISCYLEARSAMFLPYVLSIWLSLWTLWITPWNFSLLNFSFSFPCLQSKIPNINYEFSQKHWQYSLGSEHGLQCPATSTEMSILYLKWKWNSMKRWC